MMERTRMLEVGLVYGILRTVNRRRTWPCDIRIVKGNLHTALGDPCIRVGLCKSSCEETAEEALRVKSQSLCTRPLTDESSSPAAQQHSSTPEDRRNQPNPSWQQGTIFTKTTVSPCHHVTQMPTSFGDATEGPRHGHGDARPVRRPYVEGVAQTHGVWDH